MNEAYPIIADYFRFGIELGIIEIDEAIAWANSVIEKEEQPSGEFVELALSRPRGKFGVIEALNEIPGLRNPQKSGRWLLGDLKQKTNKEDEIPFLAKKCLDIAWLSQLPEDERYRFDWIDDEISLAQEGTYGTLSQCQNELKNELAKYRGYKET